MESGGGTEIRKVIFYLTILWILHWFISCSGVVVLGLWKLIYASSDVCLTYCDDMYFSLVVDIYFNFH